MLASQLKRARSAVVTVGDGRGFVVNCWWKRVVISAAHCLPFFPPCHGMSYLEDRTYKTSLAPLGSEPAVWAECLFADPIADIAVLGSPGDQELYDEANVYEALVESAIPIAIADAPEEGRGWVLSLEQEWFGCTVKYMKQVDSALLICDTAQPIVGGMSGSPVISDEGAAIGIVALSRGLSATFLLGFCAHNRHRIKHDRDLTALHACTVRMIGTGL
jgi:hypothetical protein